MPPDLSEILEGGKLYKSGIRRLAMRLPVDDAELDIWIADAIKEKNQVLMIALIIAALHAGRKLDARHLATGAHMMIAGAIVQKYAWNATGDVPGQLMIALEKTLMVHELQVCAVLVIALWCKEHCNGVFPEGFLRAARRVARYKEENKLVAHVNTLVSIVEDEGLTKIVTEDGPISDIEVKACLALTMGHCTGPALDLVLDRQAGLIATGFTMRRAVAKVGRNDPCPCGSGRKYKQCCMEKDQHRLKDSSELSGVTRGELRFAPETELTRARLEKTNPIDLARMDPLKVPKDLQGEYLTKLAVYQNHERAAEAFEIIGYAPELKETWDNIMFLAAAVRRRDVLLRLMKLHPEPPDVDTLHLSIGLLLVEDNPAKVLSSIEASALDTLRQNDDANYSGFAWGLLVSQFPALGIITARSVIPVLPTDEANKIYENLLQARDRLNLPPDDQFGDILDERMRKETADDAKTEVALREAGQRLEDKAKEVRQLNEAVHQLQRELDLRAKRSTQSKPTPVAAAVEQRASDGLLEKMEALKEDLKKQHSERNELRRELQRTKTDLAAFKATTTAPVAREEHDSEEDLVLPEENNATQPVRLIEFPHKFLDTLNGFPRHVARAGMSMIGRLAAGEPAAFVGVVRLKACPTTLRQRIGIDFRLLFRLFPDRLQVIDLINRRDLDRRIKRL